MKINVAQIYDNISKRIAEITLPQWSSKYFAGGILTERNPGLEDRLGLFEHQANGHNLELKPPPEGFGKTKRAPGRQERFVEMHTQQFVRGAPAKETVKSIDADQWVSEVARDLPCKVLPLNKLRSVIEWERVREDFMSLPHGERLTTTFFTTQRRKLFLTALRDLCLALASNDGEYLPPLNSPAHGICSLFTKYRLTPKMDWESIGLRTGIRVAFATEGLICQIFAGWPGGTGIAKFPIKPHSRSPYSPALYYNNGKRWSKYGRKQRIALLKYVAEQAQILLGKGC